MGEATVARRGRSERAESLPRLLLLALEGVVRARCILVRMRAVASRVSILISPVDSLLHRVLIIIA